MRVIKRVFLLILVVFVVSCFLENGIFLQKEDFLFLPNSFVKIGIPFGEWEIIGWDRKEAKILISKNSELSEDAIYAKFKINKHENGFEIIPEFERSLKEYVEIKGKIFIPFNSNLELDVEEGRLTISSIEGNVNIKGGGVVKLDDVSGKVKIHLYRGEVLMYVFDDSDNNSYSVSVETGNIYFYAPLSLKFKIKATVERGKIEKKSIFEYGGSEVVLKTGSGDITIDRI